MVNAYSFWAWWSSLSNSLAVGESRFRKQNIQPEMVDFGLFSPLERLIESFCRIDPSMFDLVFLDHEIPSLANFKYELEQITNSEVSILVRKAVKAKVVADRRKEKKAAK